MMNHTSHFLRDTRKTRKAGNEADIDSAHDIADPK